MRSFRIFVVVVLVSAFVACVPWFVSPAGDFVWLLRVAMPALAFLAIGFTARLMLRNRAPDYLSWVARQGYFDRSGFAFAFRMGRCGQQAYLYVYFQNQYERPCEAEVAIRPARWFFQAPLPLDPIRLRIECGPAACGVARVPFAVPRELQGNGLNFVVGASVVYAHGRGRCMRYAVGLPVERDANLSWTPWGSGHGMPVRLAVPEEVDETSKEAPLCEVRTHWIASDEPLTAWPVDPWTTDK